MSSTPSPPSGASSLGETPVPRSAYALGSTSNMIRSLVVILALVGVLVAIVPRVSEVDQPAVDAVAVASNAVRESGLAFEVPVGLPAGWKATNARYVPAADSLLTWQAGWTTPQGGYVAIRQARAASPTWLRVATSDGVAQGTLEASGRTWQRYYDPARKRTSLVANTGPASVGASSSPSGSADSLTTVVTATASLDEILTFTNALQPAPPR